MDAWINSICRIMDGHESSKIIEDSNNKIMLPRERVLVSGPMSLYLDLYTPQEMLNLHE